MISIDQQKVVFPAHYMRLPIWVSNYSYFEQCLYLYFSVFCCFLFGKKKQNKTKSHFENIGNLERKWYISIYVSAISIIQQYEHFSWILYNYKWKIRSSSENELQIKYLHDNPLKTVPVNSLFAFPINNELKIASKQSVECTQ